MTEEVKTREKEEQMSDVVKKEKRKVEKQRVRITGIGEEGMQIV